MGSVSLHRLSIEIHSEPSASIFAMPTCGRWIVGELFMHNLDAINELTTHELIDCHVDPLLMFLIHPMTPDIRDPKDTKWWESVCQSRQVSLAPSLDPQTACQSKKP